MRENDEYIKYLKYIVVVGVFVIGCYWYTALEEPYTEPENLSVFLLCVYFMAALVLCKLGGYVQYCLQCCSKARIREQARVYLYTTHHNVLRAYFPSTIGESLDLFIVLLSVGSCFMYIIETYFPFLVEETGWQMVELAISCIFLVDYMLRITLAVDMLQYSLSLFGVINVLTVLPVLVYTSDRLFKEATGTWNPSVGKSTKLTYLRLLRLAKLLRILRSMNVVKSSSSENVRREIVGLVFTVLTMIFSAAGVYQWLENDDKCFNADFTNTLNVEDYTTPGKYSDNGCVYFHQAFYWCTIEVLGRPRLIMKEHTTIVMLVCLVGLSVLLIPRHLASVVQALQTTNVYQRLTYRKSGIASRHLVLVGHKEFASLNMLLYEIFHPDREGSKPPGMSIQDVVLLFPNFPDRDTLALLAHPAYIGRVTYLQGSPLNEKDLMRASIGTAAGVIVLADKDSEVPHWHDGELLTCIQSMKAFWLKDVVHEHELSNRGKHFRSSHEVKQHLRPCIVTQVLLPETKEYLVELPGWTDRDVVVVCSEYVAWMTAMASMGRGMATVAFNLTSHTETQRQYHTKWYPRYEAGATQEIYSRKVKSGGALDQCDVKKASEILASKRVLLIAFERKVVAGHEEDTDEGVHLFPGPPGFKLKAHDRLFCIAQSNPALQKAFASVGDGAKATESRMTFRVAEEPRRSSRFSASSATSSVKRMWNSRARTWTTALTTDDDENNQFQAEMVHEYSDSDFHHHGSYTSGRSRVPRGCEDVSRYVAIKANGARSHETSSSDSQAPVVALLRKPTTPALPIDTWMSPTQSMGIAARKNRRKALYDKLCAIEPPWSRHVVICGLPQTQLGRHGGKGLVTELIETLLKSHNVGPRPQEKTKVCIIDDDAANRMADLCLIEPDLADAVDEDRLRAVSADPRKREALTTEASVHSAMTVVALPEHVIEARSQKMSIVEMKDGVNRPKMMKQIIDTNTVLTMEVARGCAERVRRKSLAPSLHRFSDADTPSESLHSLDANRKVHCVTLLLQESTTNLFYGHANMRHSGAAVTDPRWMDISPLNMSPLFASGELLAMTCFDRFAVEALFTPQIAQLMKMFLFGDSHGHHLYQVYCPAEFVKHPYAMLVEQLRNDGQIAIAMMRSPNKEGKTFVKGEKTEHDGLPDASLPYVVTNPEPDSLIMQKSDLIFIIGNRGESDLVSKQDTAEQIALDRLSHNGISSDDLQVKLGDEPSCVIGGDGDSCSIERSLEAEEDVKPLVSSGELSLVLL